MNIHEYQAKDLFRRFNITTSKGEVFEDAEAAEQYAQSINAKEYVVKAQIHAGGRGKAGGVKLVKTPNNLFFKNPFTFLNGLEKNSWTTNDNFLLGS